VSRDQFIGRNKLIFLFGNTQEDMSNPIRVIRTPDQRLRVFVSSTLRELAEERQAAQEAIRRLRLAPVMFEMGARPHPASDLYRAYLDQSHIFLGIYWQSYGWVAPGMEVSGLEDEYLLSGEKPKLIYIKSPAPDREAGLKALLGRIKSDDEVSYKYFSTAEELQEQIERDLALLLTERFELSQAQPEPIIGRKELPHHNLPAQVTSFIGREKEKLELNGILDREDVRLLTLTGPGGTGKTRLAQRVALQQIDRFEDGVFFVPLAEARERDLVVSKIAQTLGVREGGSLSLLESLASYLQDKQILLLLDNFEQVVVAAPVITELLKASERLKVLVTSRARLNLSGEVEYLVPPLELPEKQPDQDVEVLYRAEAVAMFVDRARAANPSFVFDGENVALVAEICRRLDGLPLAIELAAARTKILTPVVILELLSSRLGLLTGGPRDLPERQQALRNTLEWSVNLLTEDAKQLFARLGVFVGGFTLEAANAICAMDEECGAGLDVFEGVTSLINNSLLRMEEIPLIGPRFRMLETIREYALEQLAAYGESEALQERHAQYYSEKIIQLGSKYGTAEAEYWLDWTGVEHDNLRATLSWSMSNPAGQVLAPWLLTSMLWFWYRRGFLIEGREWCHRLLNSPVVDLSVEAKGVALFSNGAMAMWQGDLNNALSFISEAVEMVRRVEDPFLIANTLLFHGTALVNHGEDERALPQLKESLDLFKQLDMPWSQAITLVHMGNAALGMGDPSLAQTYLEQAHKTGREVGERWLLSLVLNNYGEVTRVQGDYPRARDFYQESEMILREMGDKGDLARLVHNLGCVDLHIGNMEKAEKQFRESMSMFKKLSNQRGMSECLASLARVWMARERIYNATTLISAAKALLSETGGVWWPADRVEVERALQVLEESLGEEEYTEAWEKGQRMTLDEAMDYASEVAEIS
jgi:predicted ATPase/Tfp pilus assembly protein PilF